jgi:hypothetical protein
MTGRSTRTALAVAVSLLVFGAAARERPIDRRYRRCSAARGDVAARRSDGVVRGRHLATGSAHDGVHRLFRHWHDVLHRDGPHAHGLEVRTAPTPEEAVASITGLGAYCGTFRVNATEGSVVHHMEIERFRT